MVIVCCNYEISKFLLISCLVLILGDDWKCCKYNCMFVILINLDLYILISLKFKLKKIIKIEIFF